MLPKFNNQQEAFSYALKDDADAIAFVMLVCTVLHVWDDLEDRDKSLGREQINEAFYMALVVLPRNRFYQAHFSELSPILDSAILNWHAANQMERSDLATDKAIAFITRSEYCNLLIVSARIVGGYAWAREVAADIRRFWHKEGFEGYLKNLQQQFDKEKELVRVFN